MLVAWNNKQCRGDRWRQGTTTMLEKVMRERNKIRDERYVTRREGGYRAIERKKEGIKC